MSKPLSIVTHSDPRSPSAEAYRILRTNLQFSSPDNPIHSVAVTSITPDEGKTTTTGNVAVTFAQAGMRVLLVDGDLRKPKVHESFGLSNSGGLTNLVVTAAQPGEVIQPCWVDNLHVLPSGPIPPNPAELLNSKRAKQLFAWFEKNYEMVVVDCPPVAAVSDALIISTMVSGTLLVIKYGAVAREMAKATVEQFRKINVNLLGVVLNMVPSTGGDYYYYHYGKK